MDSNKKRDKIGFAVYVMYAGALLLSIVLMVKLLYLMIFFKPNPEISKALQNRSTYTSIEPARGNIIDCEGRLLAISCPSYQLYMDCTVRKEFFKSKKNKEEGRRLELEWREKARELSLELEEVFPEKTSNQHYNAIINGRETGKRYLKIGGRIDHNTYNKVCQFPLFREGRYKSGLITETEIIRQYPYGELARRTIGFVRNNKEIANSHIGLEGKFDYVLHGSEGHEWLRHTDEGLVVNNDSSRVKPVAGRDLRTTINIDYQDIADKALRSEVEEKEDLVGASLVLMETKTGAIRAMVNLTRNPKTGRYEEVQNFAVTRKCEPGSVFKTVTLMSVLSDGYVKSLDESFPTSSIQVAGTDIRDQHIADFRRDHGKDRITIGEGLNISSNFVFASLAVKNYGKHPERFIQNIYDYKLGEAFDFDLDGMPAPTVLSPKNTAWSNNILGRIGFGYATEETPMHILTFYNAIANKGRMMKPYLVEDIELHGIVTDKRGPAVLNASVCSRAVADTLTRALEGVVSDGTAKWSLRGVPCKVAGKTGTSFGSFGASGYTDEQGRKKYQGTFVAFFPSDDPQYTITSTVYSEPTRTQYQGGGTPATAARSAISEIWNIDPRFREEIRAAK
ncbi:MAG: penicillin-binding protein 2 [Bacteroidales bacterium]|nr:penicillin-binding protein 2 [Bacteroidales bacterium]